MKLSALWPRIAARHARCEEDDPMLPIYLDAAKALVLSHTGLSLEEADKHAELALAALILTADMYDNRQATVESDKVNRVFENLVAAHDHNLLPGQAVM